MATYGTYKTPSGFKLAFYGIAIVAAFLIMIYVVRGMYHEKNPGRVNSARAAERIKARQELMQKSSGALQYGGVIDTNKGLLRIPIARAMEMTVEAYKNPEAARSNLVLRAEKAAAPPPPVSYE